MKNLLFVLFSATLILGSCTKDNNSPRLSEEEKMDDVLEAYQSFTTDVLDAASFDEIDQAIPTSDCEYYSCSAEMQAWMIEHQAIADETCKTQNGSIVCCMGDFWVVLHLVANPQDADCGEYKEVEALSLDIAPVK